MPPVHSVLPNFSCNSCFCVQQSSHILDVDTIVLPIHHEYGHWTCVCIDLAAPHIHHYDSIAASSLEVHWSNTACTQAPVFLPDTCLFLTSWSEMRVCSRMCCFLTDPVVALTERAGCDTAYATLAAIHCRTRRSWQFLWPGCSCHFVARHALSSVFDSSTSAKWKHFSFLPLEP